MGARFLFIGTASLCLVAGNNGAQAQTAPGGDEVLPAIEVVSPGPAAKPVRSTRGRSAPRTAATRNVRRVLVYPTAPTPVAGTGIDVDKVPASVNAVGAAQIARTDSLNIADALQQHVPGLIVSDTTGNPFMPDVQFRGFVASPVAG
ncbi:MAG TPA: Plug domain-containing protein, partial [Bradyrhizobium sp.]|nr:Plug domain-containing protein [Bradyrhizobium sp.]